MGPKNACSYADLAMGIIDEKAKTQGPIAPNYWWRYRDDVVDIWTLGLEKLLEFTDFINSLYPTIRFELVHSPTKLNVLDITIYLKDGFLVTDVYAKPTDSHLYLPFNSSHPAHCKTSIPFSVALRLRRNCSTDTTFAKRSGEYRNYLQRQGYKHNLIDKGFHRAALITRSDLLKPKFKPLDKKYPLVLDFNPRLPDISKILKKHIHLISDSPALREIFPKHSIIPAFRRTKNLKELIAPSKFKAYTPPTRTTDCGFFTCDNKCDLCQNFSTKSINFHSSTTGFTYKIKEKMDCTSKNVVYLVTCTKCNIQYTGSTSTQFKVRFRNHKSSMLTNKKTCELAVHYNKTPHNLKDFTFLPIEQIYQTNDNNKALLLREAYWMAQLQTLHPYGLNKRNELHSKNRISFSV